MIYVTGDTHGDIDFGKVRQFAEENKDRLTRDDYLIIAGDCGAVWSEKTLAEDLKKYKALPFTVLFVDGNHENFNMLEAYPVEIWKGGKIHRITDNLFHLMRGQIFEIEGKRILTLGGAESTDRYLRTENVSWWAQEEITQDDVDEALKNLARYDGCVDYIITHACSANVLQFIRDPYLINNKLSRQFSIMLRQESIFLNVIEDNVKEYKHWYFGHYHGDFDFDNRHRLVYNDILPLD